MYVFNVSDPFKVREIYNASYPSIHELGVHLHV